MSIAEWAIAALLFCIWAAVVFVAANLHDMVRAVNQLDRTLDRHLPLLGYHRQSRSLGQTWMTTGPTWMATEPPREYRAPLWEQKP